MNFESLKSSKFESFKEDIIQKEQMDKIRGGIKIGQLTTMGADADVVRFILDDGRVVLEILDCCYASTYYPPPDEDSNEDHFAMDKYFIEYLP